MAYFAVRLKGSSIVEVYEADDAEKLRKERKRHFELRTGMTINDDEIIVKEIPSGVDITDVGNYMGTVEDLKRKNDLFEKIGL